MTRWGCLDAGREGLDLTRNARKESDDGAVHGVHRIDGGVGLADVAKAHEADLQTQEGHGVKYLRYWVSEEQGQIFCLVDAPDADAANAVHREAHGLVADEIYPVSEGA